MKYKSNGKILLTSEYLILDGAVALALPSKLSQTLEVKKTKISNHISWSSYDYDGRKWFDDIFSISKGNFVYNRRKNKYSDKLVSIFDQIIKLNNTALTNTGLEFITKLEFSKDWGLGSSSTLINNLSLWANIDPYNLLDLTFNGSGYDIACCNKNNPILYRKTKNNRIIEDVNFNPPFKENLFFIYLGKKQNTSKAVKYYRNNANDIKNNVQKINSISLSILKSKSLNEFENLTVEHEAIVSNAIKIEPIKNRLFKDYKYGVIKSLGAWGGDFILVSGNKSSIDYFKNKGYNNIIPYKDLVY
tara:strand:+ start:1368 stop:2276 length:909 start_codon:yes stop_codon:yes gene_type:complete